MKGSKNFKGKQILLSGLVALVLVAGYYRWTVDEKGKTIEVINEINPVSEESIESSETFSNISAGETNYFDKSKYERDLARSESIETLRILSEDEENDEKVKETENKISEIALRGEKESVIENLIIAKGFSDCVVFIEDNSLSVVVKADSLDKSAVNKIKDIVLTQTDFKSSQIRISSKN